MPSPSMERLDRLVRSGEEAKMFLDPFLCFKVTVAPMAASKCGLVSIVVLMTVGRCSASNAGNGSIGFILDHSALSNRVAKDNLFFLHFKVGMDAFVANF